MINVLKKMKKGKEITEKQAFLTSMQSQFKMVVKADNPKHKDRKFIDPAGIKGYKKLVTEWKLKKAKEQDFNNLKVLKRWEKIVGA